MSRFTQYILITFMLLTLNSCKKDIKQIEQQQIEQPVTTTDTAIPSAPSISTNAISNLSTTTATTGGKITDANHIVNKGVCYSTKTTPTITGLHTTNMAKTTVYTSVLKDLQPNTTYYVRAYVTTDTTTYYGNEISWTTLANIPVASHQTKTKRSHTSVLPKKTKSLRASKKIVIAVDSITHITSTTAITHGTMINKRIDTILRSGLTYGTNPNLTIRNRYFPWPSKKTVFKNHLTDLTPMTTYYVRPYMTTCKDTLYGKVQQFKTKRTPTVTVTAKPSTPVTDVDGNTYNTIQIENQVWMAENLRVTHYPNGDPIPMIKGNRAWAALKNTSTDDAYAYFYNAKENGRMGILYTYAAAIAYDWTKDLGNNQGICPKGWHVPSDSEWKVLELNLGMSIENTEVKEVNKLKWRGTNEGDKLKATNQWVLNAKANNSSGFSALPTGVRYGYNGMFDGAGVLTTWWTRSEATVTSAYTRTLSNTKAKIYRYNYARSYGFCVRCVKN